MTLALGDPLPAFALPAVDGTEATTDGRDGPVVVAFWCNHCPYVRAWEDRLNAIATDYAERVTIIAVNANDAAAYPADGFPEMRARARERSFGFGYAHDETQDVARRFGAERTPEVFLFDAGGALRYRGAIDDSTDAAGVRATYLRDAVDAVLTGGAVDVATTPAVGCTIKWRRATA